MHTIVLATQKGGSGKSTLAIGLALAARQAGHVVHLIETDRQGTLSNWQARRSDAEPIVETSYQAGEIEPRLRALAERGVGIAFVDTASGLSASTTAAIRLCDLCLIPARPSVADIEATVPTLSSARAWNRQFAFVLNQTPIRGQRIDNAAKALCGEAAPDLADVLARPFIAMRNDHQDALAAGLGVVEYAPGSKSADEIRGLWCWIEERLDLSVATEEHVASEFTAASGLFPAMATPTPNKVAVRTS